MLTNQPTYSVPIEFEGVRVVIMINPDDGVPVVHIDCDESLDNEQSRTQCRVYLNGEPLFEGDDL